MAGHEPDVYTHGHHESVLRSHRWRTAENSAGYLIPHLFAGTSILDVGCGPGTLTVDLAAHVAPGRVVGVDLSPKVVDQARAYAAEIGSRALSFIAGDLQDLALPAGSFDIVHAHQVLQHLRDPVAALRSMAVLARPGGLVAVRDVIHSSLAWAPREPRLERWREVYLAVTRHNGAEADAGVFLPLWAAEAGLSDITFSSSTWTYTTPEDRAWWGHLWADRMLASDLAEQAITYGVANREELDGIAAGWRDWAASPVGTFIVAHGELIARV
jgi:SAM-dependent methyltransferase